MKVILGSDHAGLALKEKLKRFLDKKKISYEDLGTHSTAAVDYPDYAKKVARKVTTTRNTKGILICGTGTGMVMAANKVKGARAVLAYDNYSAKMSRKHNDANILCLRGRFFSQDKALRITSTWLTTPFSGEARHKKRIKKLEGR